MLPIIMLSIIMLPIIMLPIIMLPIIMLPIIHEGLRREGGRGIQRRPTIKTVCSMQVKFTLQEFAQTQNTTGRTAGIAEFLKHWLCAYKLSFLCVRNMQCFISSRLYFSMSHFFIKPYSSPRHFTHRLSRLNRLVQFTLDQVMPGSFYVTLGLGRLGQIRLRRVMFGFVS